MPNWSDENGRYWWKPPGETFDQEIPHPPVIPDEDCGCVFCEYNLSKNRKSQRCYFKKDAV